MAKTFTVIEAPEPIEGEEVIAITDDDKRVEISEQVTVTESTSIADLKRQHAGYMAQVVKYSALADGIIDQINAITTKTSLVTTDVPVKSDTPK